jgi:branched-chain amino acid transport system substrate-binding protein
LRHNTDQEETRMLRPAIASLRVAAAAAASLALGLASPAFAQRISDDVVRIGVLTDLSGIYSDNTGPGSVLAAQMAVADFGGKVLGKPIEVVSADHQNKPDIGAGKAREWFDRERVDVITDLVNAAVTLSVMRIAKEKDRVVLVTGTGSTRVTNEECNDRTVQWGFDTYALARAPIKSIIDSGGDTWYFITADYSFGHSVETGASAQIRELGGKVVGSTRHPFPGSDFAAVLLQAQGSGAKVIGLANAGSDLRNTLKQAHEFRITDKQRIVAMLMTDNDVHGIGLTDAQGLFFGTPFYWDRDDQTRAFSKRFFERLKKMPNFAQASTYSAVTHYLQAVKKAGTDEAGAVMKAMRETPVNDMYARGKRIRADGQLITDMYMVQVKTPAESKYPWDYYHIVRTVPGSEAFLPLSQSKCPLVKQ